MPSEADVKRFQLKNIKDCLANANIDEKFFELIEKSQLECDKPRRDGSSCFFCDSCYKRWEAERKVGIKHDQAIDAIMAMYEEHGRE